MTKGMNRRRANKADMNVSEQIEAAKEAMCRDYCKHTEAYLATYKDPDDAEERLLADMCNYCPLNSL